jgi:hypothetical protein
MKDRAIAVADPEELWWAPDAFYAEAGTAATPIDITGHARILFWGPYIELPPGLWRAEVRLECCAEAARYDYLIEFGTVARFSRTVFRPEPGACTLVDTTYRTTEPWRSELRAWVARPAFHGELRLVGARLLRIESEPAAAAQ